MKYAIYSLSTMRDGTIALTLHTETTSPSVAEAALQEAAKFACQYVIMVQDGKPIKAVASNTSVAK